MFLPARTTQGEGSDRLTAPSPLPLLCINTTRRTPPFRPAPALFPRLSRLFYFFPTRGHPRGRWPQIRGKLMPKCLLKTEGMRSRHGFKAGEGKKGFRGVGGAEREVDFGDMHSISPHPPDRFYEFKTR